MKTYPIISVVIPAYNEESLIERCLTSLKNQTFNKPFEIILVDNNCTDQTVNIAKKFNVKIVKEPHQGVVWARQKGLLEAKGEIIACADCDCEYPENWLEKIYTQLVSHPQVVGIGGPGIAEENPHWAYLIYKISFAIVNHFYHLTQHVLYLSAFNFSFKRKVFLNLGGYRTYLEQGGGDELDPLSRLQKAGKVIYDHSLTVNISTRRYREGFWKFLFVHCFYYYHMNYWTGLLFKKVLVHPKPVRNL